MKKLLVSVFVLVCVFTLFACNQSETTQDTNSMGTSTIETNPAETESIETNPTETESIETNPTEIESIETTPTETESIETNPTQIPSDILDSTQAGDTIVEDPLSECLLNENGIQYILLPISKIKIQVSSTYKSHLNNLDFDLLKSAEERITEKMSAYTNNSGVYLQADNAGYLYLCLEAIVNINPPNVVTGENGEIIDGGCNIDHRHIFFSERITK